MSDTKRPVGRPRIITTPEEFDERVDAYIAECKEKEEPVLLTGMILALGLNSKNTFYEYENYPEFSDSVKKARLLVEMEYEKRLCTSPSATGSIFALKNFGWRDKVEADISNSDGSLKPIIIEFIAPNIQNNHDESSS